MNTNWIPFQEVNWESNYNCFSIDTRGFYCSSQNIEDVPEKGTIFTKEEMLTVVTRLYEESGGKGMWRMLILTVNEPDVNNWNLKYLRIYKKDGGFLICNSSSKPLTKLVLTSAVDQRYLNYH